MLKNYLKSCLQDRNSSFSILYRTKTRKIIKRNLISYWTKINFLSSINLFILNKNPFFTEQKSISYRAINSHPKKILIDILIFCIKTFLIVWIRSLLTSTYKEILHCCYQKQLFVIDMHQFIYHSLNVLHKTIVGFTATTTTTTLR